MKISAVICEYNPLHLGHAYQLSEMKKAGAVIALMSGSFTQRGTPAVISKYERAKSAVLTGADLVLELPFPFSSARAEDFGRGGVEILNRLGCVDTLCFGSERGDTNELLEAETRLSSPAFEAVLSEILEKGHGISHHTAMEKAYRRLYGEESPLFGSNDLLALSYLRALRETDSKITPRAIQRVGEAYNGGGEGFASATTVRRLLKNESLDSVRHVIPNESLNVLKNAWEKGYFGKEDAVYPLFAALVRGENMPTGALIDTPRELYDRMKKAALTAASLEEFLTLAAARRFSPSRIRRGMLYALLNVKKADLAHPAYTSVLAANETGREILAAIRKTADIPIITKPADGLQNEKIAKAFALSARADSLWTLLLQTPLSGDAMLKEHPRML